MRLKVLWRDGWAYACGTGPDGVRIRRALKTQDPRRAEEARANLEARLWRIGLYGSDEVTFDECALSYAEDGGDTRFLVPVSRLLAGRKLRDITPKMIRDIARRLYPSAKPATLNRQVITPARAVINFGHQQGWCAPIRVQSFEADKPKRQAVTRAYLDRLRPHIPHHLFVLLLFLHTTGRRVGEALALRPDDIVDRRVTIPMTKNGEAAVTFLTEEVAEMISGLEETGATVFGYTRRDSVYSTLRRGCKAAGLPYLGTHQIGRHSFATTLSEAGWGSKAIAEAGGWKSVRLVAETYEHPENAAVRASAVFDTKLTQRRVGDRKNPKE